MRPSSSSRYDDYLALYGFLIMLAGAIGVLATKSLLAWGVTFGGFVAFLWGIRD